MSHRGQTIEKAYMWEGLEVQIWQREGMRDGICLVYPTTQVQTPRGQEHVGLIKDLNESLAFQDDLIGRI